MKILYEEHYIQISYLYEGSINDNTYKKTSNKFESFYIDIVKICISILLTLFSL